MSAIVTVAGNVQDTGTAATVNSRPKRCLRRFQMSAGTRPGEFFKLCSLCFKLHPLTCQPAGMSVASEQIHRILWKPYLALTMWWIWHVILWVWLLKSACPSFSFPLSNLWFPCIICTCVLLTLSAPGSSYLSLHIFSQFGQNFPFNICFQSTMHNKS